MPLFPQATSQPATVTTPGDLLLRLNDTRHVGAFSSVVLRGYLCPALDALPADQRANLLTILQEAERATVELSPYFGRLDLSGEASDDDDASSDDGGGLGDPSNLTSVQFTERKRRIEALIAVEAPNKIPTRELEEEVLSWLPVLWHLGVEGATNVSEVLAALKLCDAIRCVKWRALGPFFRLTGLLLARIPPARWIALS